MKQTPGSVQRLNEVNCNGILSIVIKESHNVSQ